MTSSIVRPAVLLLLVLTLITGIAYPLVITGIAQVAFSDAANGSIITRDGTPIASRLIGQSFTEPKYFWSRPSATAPRPYNGIASGGSNLGPLNPALIDSVKQRIAALRAADPGNTQPVPIDLVTASASGLDPHVSLAGIEYQVPRVARVRHMPPENIRKLVAQYTERKTFGVLGEVRVNLVRLNLALDAGDGRTSSIRNASD
jgi:K+-transporting ATPase ATPase C chain